MLDGLKAQKQSLWAEHCLNPVRLAEALTTSCEDIPVIYDADIGHTNPHFTMINGAILNLHYKHHHASITFELK